MSAGFVSERKKIYDWLKKQGLEFTEAQHEEIKALLLEYTERISDELKKQVRAYEVHLKACKLYKAKINKRKSMAGMKKDTPIH